MLCKKISFAIAVLITVGIWGACKHKDTAGNGELPAGFERFYKRFHSDSLYQMAHINFPLEGYPMDVDSATFAAGTFRWQKEVWIMHHPIELDSGKFERTFLVLTPTLVEETIRQSNTPFAMKRRFVKEGEDWRLIFYSDMNAMKQ